MGRRSFYEDDELITTKPGYNAAITKDLREKESSHGNISFIEGMGVRTTPYLEKHFNTVRQFLHEKFSIASAELGTQKSALANEYAILKSKVNEVILEPIVPDCVNVIFPVLVASIVVNRRSLPLRFLATSMVFGVSVKYYMPRTYGAAKLKVILWEKENFPDVWQQQIEAKKSAEDFAAGTKVYSELLKLDLQRQIHGARLWVAKLLEDE